MKFLLTQFTSETNCGSRRICRYKQLQGIWENWNVILYVHTWDRVRINHSSSKDNVDVFRIITMSLLDFGRCLSVGINL